MTHNDLLRRLRYALDLSDPRVLALVRAGGGEATEADLPGWFSREEDPGFVELPERAMTAFLDGLVLDRRGPRDPSTPPPPKVRLDNNQVLKKLRIAFELQEQDLLAMLAAGGTTFSSAELTALFRKPDHKHYRACGDQVLRHFLHGLTERQRAKR